MADFQKLKLTELKFDSTNPRLPRSIDGTKVDEVIKWMIKDASLIDLMGSMAMHGFFEGDPLIVIKERDSFKVMEGNRRLSCLFLLNDPDSAPILKKKVAELSTLAKEKINFDEIPVVVFDDELAVKSYLGFKHVTGILEWGPLEKSRYLNELSENEFYKDGSNPDYNKLAQTIGSKSNYVKRLLVSLSLFEKFKSRNFYGIEGLSEDNIAYSSFYDAISLQKHLSDYMGIDFSSESPLSNFNENNFIFLVKLLFDEKEMSRRGVKESRDIRKINKIFSFEKSTAAFVDGGLTVEDAIFITMDPALMVIQSLNVVKKLLKNVKTELAKEEIKDEKIDNLVEELKILMSAL